MSVWHPIDTAPKDGTRFLAAGGGLDSSVEVCTYNANVGAWSCETCTLDDRDDEPQGYSRPLYWLPIPVAPCVKDV